MLRALAGSLTVLLLATAAFADNPTDPGLPLPPVRQPTSQLRAPAKPQPPSWFQTVERAFLIPTLPSTPATSANPSRGVTGVLDGKPPGELPPLSPKEQEANALRSEIRMLRLDGDPADAAAVTSELQALLAPPPPPPPPPPPRVPATPAEVEILARIVKGEVPSNAPYEEAVAVAACVINRVLAGGFGSNIEQVAHAPLQFSSYNPEYRAQLYDGAIPDFAWRAAREAIAGADPVNGATYYFNPYLVHPGWANSMHFVKHYGTDDTNSADFYKP